MDGERFRVRQYFMRDYHEEGALLHALAEELGRFDQLVTFNGKMFDVPLLDARFRLNRGRFPLAGAPHLDLLHPARRLWKARLESCRLQSLEAELMGLRRHGDIAGEEIPHVYFDWVRRRDARMLARVFEHNRQDIVSLAALAVLACQWVEDGQAEDARDIYSLARAERGGSRVRGRVRARSRSVRLAGLAAAARARAEAGGEYERAAAPPPRAKPARWTRAWRSGPTSTGAALAGARGPSAVSLWEPLRRTGAPGTRPRAAASAQRTGEARRAEGAELGAHRRPASQEARSSSGRSRPSSAV